LPVLSITDTFTFLQDVGRNVATHLDLRYLFFYGDQNLRHGSGTSGIMVWGSLPLMAAGLLVLLKKKRGEGLVLLGWWMVAVLPAALVYEVPHSLRTLNALPMIILLQALGAGYFFRHNRRWLVYALSLVFIWSTWLYGYDYFNHYPKRAAASWQLSYKQLVERLKTYEGEYREIYVPEIDRYYLFHLFYHRIEPAVYREQLGKSGKGLIGSYRLGGDLDQVLALHDPQVLIVLPAENEYDATKYRLVEVVYEYDRPAFQLITATAL
jgi:hypothetical protein